MASMSLQLNGILLRPTAEKDLDTVIEMERHNENTPYIRQWSREKHRDALTDQNIAHFVIESENKNELLGYIILIGLKDPDKNLEFKRIVVGNKGKGVGRTAVKLIKKYAFEHTDTHRFWLEVTVNNIRAHHVYESEGFLTEGIHRESLKQGDKFISLTVMSLLRHEYVKE